MNWWMVTSLIQVCLLALVTANALKWARRAAEAQGLLRLQQASKAWQQPDNDKTRLRQTIVRLVNLLTNAQECIKEAGKYIGPGDDYYNETAGMFQQITEALAAQDLVKELGTFEPTTAQVCVALNYLGPAPVVLKAPPLVEGGEVKDRTMTTTLERIWSSEQLAVFIREAVSVAQMPCSHPTGYFDQEFYDRIDATRGKKLYEQRQPNAKTLHERARKGEQHADGK